MTEELESLVPSTLSRPLSAVCIFGCGVLTFVALASARWAGDAPLAPSESLEAAAITRLGHKRESACWLVSLIRIS